MKLIRAICLLGLILIVSCQNRNEVKKPENLLSSSEMKDLIYDMVLLDAAAVVNDKKLKELDVEILQFLSKKYTIDSTDLKQNILYYNMRFDENLDIFEKAKDSIERLDRVYDSISNLRDSLRRAEMKIRDSIKNIDSLSTDKTLPKLKLNN
ncbi:DUF4296 domain-containing protein [Psychroflexus sp. YR1-1]|uniref:DUF4296 domain-containing protein n=1 Tax=Psychroflexus aurantiacus TaxID=2709310 RepID=A0A6B3R5B0_9FLAO|nr:DUF4296 domain-containing protein [Psychroflexus aurantiacus]NEV94750.1 DUF4296 domain-containing protein [Psychroflexus aurantiacus]